MTKARLTPELTKAGREMHDQARALFPIARSLTGEGFRKTLRALQKDLPGLKIESVPSGTPAFDWTVPDEWTIRSARLTGPDGAVVADFAVSNLQVVGYSVPVKEDLTLEQLQPHLHSLPKQPDAIPYVTSYYKRNWGFCLTDRARKKLKRGTYRAVIDSTLMPGVLNYGELLIPGETRAEVLLSTYCCHPSLGNNELSGPVVTARLARWLLEKPRRLSYRILFVPETIGSIVYLSRHLAELKKRVKAGFVVTCVGDDRAYSYLPSRAGNTLADRAALHALKGVPKLKRYSFLDRGSDERQYCSPGADLPVASIMRSKYAEYPEYHTSLDDLKVITPAGLAGGFAALRRALEYLEAAEVLRAAAPCEPQLGKRGLYPTTSVKGAYASTRLMMNALAYADGTRDLPGLAEAAGVPVEALRPVVETLKAAGLLVPAWTE